MKLKLFGYYRLWAAVITVFACVVALNVWTLSGGGGGSGGLPGGDQPQPPDLQRRSALLDEVVRGLRRRVAELQVCGPPSPFCVGHGFCVTPVAHVDIAVTGAQTANP